MKIILSVFLLMHSSLNLAQEKERNAVVILNASIKGEEQKISNICLRNNKKCEYLNPLAPFALVPPGRYRLINVDLTNNARNGRGNIWLDPYVKFRFKKERIYFIGHLELSKKSGGKYKMNFNQDLALLYKACKSIHSEALDYPLANAKTGKELELTCEDVLNSKM